MRNYFVLLLLLLISGSAFSQKFSYQQSIGKFKNASAFTISSAGMIYVCDAVSDEIFKLDTLGNVLKYEGGYGWDEGNFDQPVDVFANPLSVYVSDKNNHRIQRFDKDLNFISLLYTRDNDNPAEHFGYPLSAVTSNQGDLFILDSENNRILKFDLFGNFIMNFGGFDAGIFALTNPKKMVVSASNNLYVLDDKKIIEFDQYGNGLNVIETDDNFKCMTLIFSNMLLNTDDRIIMKNVKESGFRFMEIKTDDTNLSEPIVSSLIFNGRLYILLSGEIRIYNLVKS
jgi:hypothetical protein